MIYLIEDNESIRETVVAYLELAGYQIKEFGGVSGVVESLEFTQPELFILDVMLPDGNGFVLAKRIRQAMPSAVFIFLTAKESEGDRITGLELGAEDYIVKPFSPRELSLRVQAILRRTGGGAGSHADKTTRRWLLDAHTLEIDSAAHSVRLDEKDIALTPVEWRILSWLTDNTNILVSKERLLGECLDYSHDGSERTVITHLKNLRAKLGDINWIETVRGFGYKFVGVSVSAQDIKK